MDVHPTVMRFLCAPPPAAWRLDGRPLGVAYETACADGADDDGDEQVDCGDPDFRWFCRASTVARRGPVRSPGGGTGQWVLNINR